MTLQAIFFLALSLFGLSGSSRHIRNRTYFGGLPRRICSAMLVLTVGFARVQPCDTARRTQGVPPIPAATDLELWAAGQTTMREQMAAALQRHILAAPLQHNRGIADPPNLTVVPPDLVGEAVLPTFEERALHVTLWVSAVYYEAETVDIEMSLPLSLSSMKSALRGACSTVPDSFEEFHPTVPQLGDYYGSFVAQPVWLRNTNRTTLVMGCQSSWWHSVRILSRGKSQSSGSCATAA